MRIIAMSSGEVSRCQCQRLFWYIRSTEKHAACAFDWQGMSLTSYEFYSDLSSSWNRCSVVAVKL